MISLNKKAFTIIELVISFTFVVILLSSLFIIVINYQNRTEKEKIKSSLINYKNNILNIVYHDIVNENIKEVKQCGNKCVEFITTKDSYVLFANKDVDGNEYLSYRDIKYNLPDSQNNLSRLGDFIYNPIDAGDNKIFGVSIPVEHAEINDEEYVDNIIEIIVSGKDLNIDEPLENRIYTINYYLGSGLEAGSLNSGVTYMGSSTCKYGSSCILKSWDSFGKQFPNADDRWEFAGWNTSQTVTSLMYEDEQSFIYNKTNDINLYAIGSRKFDFYSGVSPTSPKNTLIQYWNSFSTNATNFSSINIPSPNLIENWTFIGYSQSNNADGSSVNLVTGSKILPTDENKNFSAVYKRNIFIEYDANGGSGSIASNDGVQYYNSGYAINMINNTANVNEILLTLANNNFENLGYKYVRWAEGSETGTRYSEGATYTFDNDVLESNIVTMYAEWLIKPLRIYYNVNSGTITRNTTGGVFTTNSEGFVYKDGNIYYDTIDVLNTLNLQDYNNSEFINIIKEGYQGKNSAHWNSKKDGSGINYNQGATYNFNKYISDDNVIDNGSYYRLNIYVNWIGRTYTINYYLGNGTDIDGTTKLGSSTCTYGSECTLTKWNTFGATFPGSTYQWRYAGWTTSQTLTDFSYSDAETFVYEKKGNLNLYALGYRTFVFFSGESPTTAKSMQTQYWNPYSTHSSHASSIVVPTATNLDNGWTFHGYLLGNSANGNVLLTTTGEQVLDVQTYPSRYFRTVYKRTATIVYNANGGSGTTENTTGIQYYNSGYAEDNVNVGANNNTVDMYLSDSGFTYSGYNFNKWAKDSIDGTQYNAGDEYVFDNTVSESNIINMYANWTKSEVCNSSCGACLKWSDWISKGSTYKSASCASNPNQSSFTEKWENCSATGEIGNGICNFSCDKYVKYCTQYPCC